jgi:hypothetical protein
MHKKKTQQAAREKNDNFIASSSDRPFNYTIIGKKIITRTLAGMPDSGLSSLTGWPFSGIIKMK